MRSRAPVLAEAGPTSRVIPFPARNERAKRTAHKFAREFWPGLCRCLGYEPEGEQAAELYDRLLVIWEVVTDPEKHPRSPFEGHVDPKLCDLVMARLQG